MPLVQTGGIFFDARTVLLDSLHIIFNRTRPTRISFIFRISWRTIESHFNGKLEKCRSRLPKLFATFRG